MCVCGRISPTAHVYRTYTYETQEIVKLTIMIVQLSWFRHIVFFDNRRYSFYIR